MKNNVIIKKQQLDEAYKTLESAYKKSDFLLMTTSLDVICRFVLKKRDFVFQCMYVLVQNGYYKEVQNMIKNIQLFLKSEEIYVQTLNKAIQNQYQAAKFTIEEQEEYSSAIYYGRINYQTKNYLAAYENYKKGFEKTKHPIFLYYLGKILYKQGEYHKAKEYLVEYINVGDEKLEKAYLYLGGIEYKSGNYNLAQRYLNFSNRINKLRISDFVIDEFEILKNEIPEKEDIDVLKRKRQNIEMKAKTFQK